MQQHQSLGKKPPFLAAQRTGAPLSGEVRLCLQRHSLSTAAGWVRWFSPTEAAARSSIRDGAINRIGRSAHSGQQRTNLPRRDPHPELLRHASSQFIIGQIFAEEPNEIVCVVSIENHVVPWVELRLEANPAASDVRSRQLCWRSDGQWVRAIHRPAEIRCHVYDRAWPPIRRLSRSHRRGSCPALSTTLITTLLTKAACSGLEPVPDCWPRGGLLASL